MSELPGGENLNVWEEPRDDEAERSFVEEHGHVEEIAVGTILQYDDWQWALVTEIVTESKHPRLGFVLLDEVGDYVVDRLEPANGCRQHYLAVKHLRDGEHEYWTSIDYVEDDVWDVLGPIHPDYRDYEPEARTDGRRTTYGWGEDPGDKLEYHAIRVGRPTRTVEIAAPEEGTETIEEGTLTAEPVNREVLRTTRENGGYTGYFISPDREFGFGLEDGNWGGVSVPYDLVGIIEFPEPMTEKEAIEWLDDEQVLQYTDTPNESDLTAEDLLEEIR